ncbi:MAG: YegP family protein [Betaproteobacteria bacterium]|nr:YegP family protein [Betaproteobacteria bacterium]MDH4322536.1 YegP family protein [Betaproteobacteria bacterium]MDH5577093.1 YegP family protein [Betaproteobacteria bacterium]
MSALSEGTVRKPQALAPGLDPAPLFDHGLDRVRAYAHEQWSDHNIHDPGITALEQVCYAITDLCYRAFHPVEDLLATAQDNERSLATHFFGPRELLPNRPLTELDYRKLTIDVPGVRNAWVFAVEPAYYADPVEGRLLHEDPGLPGVRRVALRGLHGVRIECADEYAPPEAKHAILQAVKVRLQANRNLCEDFVEIAEVETQPFVLCAEIELAPDADPAQVHARVLLAVQRYLRPGVPRYTRDKVPGDDPDVFEGPAPDNGFIDARELAAAELRSVLRLSDIAGEVMDVEGVRAVREIVLRPRLEEGGAAPAETKWEITVQPLKRATLDAAHSRLVLYKGSMPVPSAGALALYETLAREAEQAYARRVPGERQVPPGRFRNPATYLSLQQHFPALYGIGEAGLPPGTSALRRAQARQLQGYLLFFDQILANAFAQLAAVRSLFSLEPDLEHSYFSQPVESVPGFRELYPSPPEDTPQEDHGAWRERIQALLDRLAETREDMLARRNRFLDHLLARYAERLQDYLAIHAALFGATPAETARAKCAFLRDYPALGAERGRAFDYSAGPAWSNVPGLEKRLAHLLALGAVTYEIYQERDVDGIDEYRFRLRRRFAEGVLLSSSTRYPSPEAAIEELQRALPLAETAAGYQRRQADDGTFYFNIVDGTGEVVARRIEYFATEAAREAAIDELKAVLAEHHSERLCVIENILLRPRPGTQADAFLPICAEPGCGDDCAGDDPYSYRLHIVLPANARRFRDPAFRRFAEEVIRQETPAHLLPKICWVSDEDMARVEGAWQTWRALLDGSDTTFRADRFAALSKALYEAKNVYPAQMLADCAASEKFVLGRSALGSLKEDGP